MSIAGGRCLATFKIEAHAIERARNEAARQGVAVFLHHRGDLTQDAWGWRTFQPRQASGSTTS